MFSEILEQRGYVYQHSAKTLAEITDGPKRTIYLGIDPTGDSIHVGNLVVYMLLRRFVDAGHKVVLLFGGGTGLIGDPKPDGERPLTDETTVAENVKKMHAQAQRLLGDVEIAMVNNHDWLGGLELIPFLRDIGKHFTVNSLIKKDAIKSRMESEDGISFTEVSYPLLQAYDYLHLHKTMGCDVQVGGSDQWGNIVAGVDLIRRKESKTVYALSTPLIVDKKSGKKFGKSEGNAVWLDPEKTSPFQFYQFWVNVGDDDVEDFLKKMTMLSMDEIEETMKAHQDAPSARPAHRKLAKAVTALIHGDETAERIERVSDALFGVGEMKDLSKEDHELLKREAPICSVSIGEGLQGVLVQSELASSKREAKQFILDGAVTLNGGRITDENRAIKPEDFQNAPIAILRRGKQKLCILSQR